MSKPRGRPRAPITDEQKQAVALMLAQGCPIRNITQITGFGRTVIERVRDMPEVVALALKYRKAMIDALGGEA